MSERINYAETNSSVQEDLGAIANATSVELDQNIVGGTTELTFNSALN